MSFGIARQNQSAFVDATAGDAFPGDSTRLAHDPCFVQTLRANPARESVRKRA